MAEETGASTTLAALKQNATSPEANLPAVPVSFDSLQGFSLMQRVAKSLGASTLVPADYQNNVANCMIALEMAHRIGASPLMVMQNLYVVYGRPGWSSQFLIASFNQCGRFTAMKFRYQGEEGTDKWGCRAVSTEKATGEEIVGPLVTIAIAKAEGWYAKKGSKWQTIPELMLMYRAAGWMVRTHAPEISMGLHTTDEVHDYGTPVDAPFTVDTDTIRGELKNGEAARAEGGQEEAASDKDLARKAKARQKEKDAEVADTFDPDSELSALYSLAEARKIEAEQLEEFVGKVLGDNPLTPEGKTQIAEWIDLQTPSTLV